MTKQFTTIKIGYTAGVYGCSGEYFTTIYNNGKELKSFTHYGMYGSEDRINHAMKEKGYKEFYSVSTYGRLKRSDIARKQVKDETEALEFIKFIN